MAIDDRQLAHVSTPLPGGILRLELSVPGIHCGGCIQTIESALNKLSEVTDARVNLTTKRVTVCFRNGPSLPAVGETLTRMGFDAWLSSSTDQRRDQTYPKLVRSLGVAAFGAMNIMMLSVAVWAGADLETRQLFHWISAAIALPTLAYSGQSFFLSAWSAVRRGRTNMDVPISIGLVITYAMSLYDTAMAGEHAYFDAATALLFFLLVGRTLDHMMRQKARTALSSLEELVPSSARVIGEDNTTKFVSVDQIEAGMRLHLAVGDRVPVDGIIEQGRSDIDVSLMTGESAPVGVGKGDQVSSGGLILSGPLELTATAKADGSLLAQMVRLMEAAEQARGRYRRLADRVSALYAPVVHLAAIGAFTTWVLLGSDLHFALTVAVSVLIITCPCALALAVPMVQVAAARRLFETGILMKDGSSLERLSEIDCIIFDKTGTLTVPEPCLAAIGGYDPSDLDIACLMAAQSNHPYARAFAKLSQPTTDGLPTIDRLIEEPGNGIEADIGGDVYRLGRIKWAVGSDQGIVDLDHDGPVLARNGDVIARFSFGDIIRDDGKYVLSRLEKMGFAVEILSGDTPAKVKKTASELGVDTFRGGMFPNEKIAHLEGMKRHLDKVLMVGDGINDAPAMAAAHIAMAPSNAADIGRNAADFVFLKEGLLNVLVSIDVARRAMQLTRQNLALAILYNGIALPFAFLGQITPLYAAIAMSTSSLIVVANAFRLRATQKYDAGGPA